MLMVASMKDTVSIAFRALWFKEIGLKLDRIFYDNFSASGTGLYSTIQTYEWLFIEEEENCHRGIYNGHAQQSV